IVSWCGIEFNGEHSNPLCFADEWYVNNEYIFELNIPDIITQIKSYTFQNANWLMFVTMGDSVASIDDGAFYGCDALTSITIGNSVTSIGSRAFEDCDNLSEINYNGTMAQWNDINKGADWNYNTGDYTVHCTDGDITK
ncbi:MAG: leucine-rich repeat domain-containing protein, partial [Christensenellales bacterium]